MKGYFKGKFYVIGLKGKKDIYTCHFDDIDYFEMKSTIGSAMRKAKRYLTKRNCTSVFVVHKNGLSKGIDIIFEIDDRSKGRGMTSPLNLSERNIENGEQ